LFIFACYEFVCVVHVLDDGSTGGRCHCVSVARRYVVAEKGEDYKLALSVVY